MSDAPMHALDAPSPAGLSPEEKLVWILGDLMNAVENYFGCENPKRLGHINRAAIRIIDEVLNAAVPALSGEPARRDEGSYVKLAFDGSLLAAPTVSGYAGEDEISPYEWLAQEFDRLAILRKMWTAHEVAAMIRRHDIERKPAPTRAEVLEEAARVADDHAEAWGLAMGQQAKEIAKAIRALAGEKP